MTTHQHTNVSTLAHINMGDSTMTTNTQHNPAPSNTQAAYNQTATIRHLMSQGFSYANAYYMATGRPASR